MGESNPTLIKSDCKDNTIHVIDFSVNLPVTLKDKQMVNSVVSIPVLSKY